MRSFVLSLLLLGFFSRPASAYIEVPHSLGRCVNDSTNIVLMEVTKVNVEKNLIIFKKLGDVKGTHAGTEIRHNIGKAGFHEREWKNIMAWAKPGEKAVFMYNAEASETCIGTYWYQAYKQGEWWGMSHAEPFLLRTFYGDPERLAELCVRMLKNEEVIAPCLADGNKDQLHQRKGKLQRLRAGLKRLDYNAKRDFVGFGADGDEPEDFQHVKLIEASSPGWKFLPMKVLGKIDDRWVNPMFEEANWREGKAPIGYGEDELAKRKGTIVAEKGQDFVFRRTFEISADSLGAKGVSFQLNVASDDSAQVWINGQVVDRDPVDDHEFAYWNREIEVPARILKAGKNLLAIRVKNKANSSDLYLDAEMEAIVPKPRANKPKTPLVLRNSTDPAVKPVVLADDPRDPDALKVDAATKTLTLKCAIAPRKLAHLNEEYPIEVIGSWAHPRGQKAHETVVTFKGIKPSEIQAAMVALGVAPGTPAYGDTGPAKGAEVELSIEFADKAGKVVRFAPEKLMVRKDGKPLPPIKWLFTGAAMKQPDPEKEAKVPGADLTGTLISVFPVTDSTIFQSQLTMKEEASIKLDTNRDLLPKEGTEAKLIIRVK